MTFTPPGWPPPTPATHTGPHPVGIVALSVGLLAALTLSLPLPLPGLVLGPLAVLAAVVGLFLHGNRHPAVGGLVLGVFTLWVAYAG